MPALHLMSLLLGCVIKFKHNSVTISFIVTYSKYSAASYARNYFLLQCFTMDVLFKGANYFKPKLLYLFPPPPRGKVGHQCTQLLPTSIFPFVEKEMYYETESPKHC